ncbi:MAG: DUF2339 domain-containing protein [Candidatus Omnitrophica bacterium]|nr:DUF2339 domain-containing protein [Candidatus Omnitrophota bacterium]
MYYFNEFDMILRLFPVLWIVSIIASPVIAAVAKNRSAIAWFLLGCIGGPVTLIIISLLPKAGPEKSEKSPAQMIGSPLSLEAIKKELDQIKTLYSDTAYRISVLENILKEPSRQEPEAKAEKAAKPEKRPAAPIPAPLIAHPALEVPAAVGLEQKMGKYWLNKVGILVLAMGVTFLISYTFKYFGPFMKILTGYIIGAGLLVIGVKLEKRAGLAYYGRSLLGGGWAIAYFTTYAMYHFQASRIIQSQLVDLILLAAVAVAILLHTLKYKSQEISSVALFVGYFTATLGDINYFTLASCLFLAVVSVVLVYKMRWLKMIFVGIALTYMTHIFWVVKQVHASFVPVGVLDVGQVQFWLNNGFVALYWLVFTVSIYLIKDQNENEKKQLAVASFSNFLPFFVLAYSKIYAQYPDFRFPFVFGLGLVYAVLALASSRMKNRVMSTVNTLIALSLVTFAVPLRQIPLSTTVIWLIELPCIMYIGWRFGKKSFRIFGLMLAAAVFVRIITLDFAVSGVFTVFGHDFTLKNFIFFIGALSSYLSVLIARRINDDVRLEKEGALTNVYSFFGTVYLTMFLWDTASKAWLGVILFEEVFILALIAFWLKDRAFRIYSYALLVAASFVLIFTENGHNFIWIMAQLPLLLILGLGYEIRPVRVIALVGSAVIFIKALAFDYHLYYTLAFFGAAITWKKVILLAGLAAMFLCDYFNRRLGQAERFAGEYPMVKAYSAIGTAYLTLFLWDAVPLRWLSLAWAFEAAALLFTGRMAKDAYFRAYSLVLLAMFSIRMVFIDANWGFEAVNWLAFAVEMALFAALYFLYKGLKEASEFEKGVPLSIFVIAAIVATSIIFKEVGRNFVSLALGVEGAAMFAIGFMAKDKVFRIGGFWLFGLTLARIILVDMAHVAAVYKIISFMVLGAIFLVTSFLYNKYNVGKDK